MIEILLEYMLIYYFVARYRNKYYIIFALYLVTKSTNSLWILLEILPQ